MGERPQLILTEAFMSLMYFQGLYAVEMGTAD